MGVGYQLVNSTRREQIIFYHLPVSKASEIIGHQIAGMLITYYLFRCVGDHIAFVSDTYDDWPFATDSRADLAAYVEVTDQIIDEMIGFGWFDEHDHTLIFEDDPEIYYRSLTPLWNTSHPCTLPRRVLFTN